LRVYSRRGSGAVDEPWVVSIEPTATKGVDVAIRDTLRTGAQPLLRQGESIEAVFAAQATSPYFSLLSIWIIVIQNGYRVVIVTDQRIIVCHSGRTRISKVNDVIAEFPRSTKIGPTSGIWYSTNALGERLYIHRRFHKDVAVADGA
jgi:hypothetical protein